MQKLIIFSYLSLLLGSTISLPAESGLTRHERTHWNQCVQALKNGDVESFKQGFTKDLLDIHILAPFSPSVPTMRPFGLAHLAAISKNHASGEMIDFLVQQGFDPNAQEAFPHKEVAVRAYGTSHVVRGFEGYIESPLPLDLAIMYGNSVAVESLLKNGADSYNTSIYRSSSFMALFLKTYVSKRIGENPLSLALEYYNAAQSGETSMPASVDEYTVVVDLVREAQLKDDIEVCSIQ